MVVKSSIVAVQKKENGFLLANNHMPRIARQMTLWSRKEIEILFKQAKRVYKNSGLDILVTPRSHHDYARLLIIIPKRVGNAPQRNLLRRRIKAIFFENKLFSGNFDWLFIVKPSLSLVSFATLQELILRIQQQLDGSLSPNS